ncbi:MAG TPA: hypothetical protein VI410_05485 [Anaerolineales bacterium]|nr:hypothetical protein [Anaerolineales bacterium]
MRVRLSALWAAVALAAGLFVLLGYFVQFKAIQDLRLTFLHWAVLLAGAALIVGLVNLVSVHWRKVGLLEEGWIYSAVLILALVITLGLGLFFGPDNAVALYIFSNFQLPVETSLMALLAVSLVVAGFRLVSRRRDLYTLIFLATALFVMVGTAPWPLPGLGTFEVVVRDLRAWISQVWAAGGARGILLGVALGATATGLRVLLGTERPYGG